MVAYFRNCPCPGVYSSFLEVSSRGGSCANCCGSYSPISQCNDTLETSATQLASISRQTSPDEHETLNHTASTSSVFQPPDVESPGLSRRASPLPITQQSQECQILLISAKQESASQFTSHSVPGDQSPHNTFARPASIHDTDIEPEPASQPQKSLIVILRTMSANQRLESPVISSAGQEASTISNARDKRKIHENIDAPRTEYLLGNLLRVADLLTR